MSNYDLITILGPTASGKTTLACHLAKSLNSEIISADSRQVYKGMDVGTGKDLDDYKINDYLIKYHLIDILEAGDKYNIYEYQHDFHDVYTRLKTKIEYPILCGGSGLYIESVLRGYSLVNVPQNSILRDEMDRFTLQELGEILKGYGPLHNTSDILEKRRAIRAIEIADYKKNNPVEINDFPAINSLIIGVSIDRDRRRSKISKRLKERLNNGMIEEVEGLLASGITPEDLIYYGLEYKYLTLYILGKIDRTEMEDKLEIAIHQFAKRQMTWFRGMEKRGLHINWIDGLLPMQEKIDQIEFLLTNKSEI